jgi:L,D-transpeptidase ErfK/SrfK
MTIPRLCLLLAMLQAGGLGAATFALPAGGDAVVGERQVVHSRTEDTLLDIALRHDHGYTALRNANPGVDPWLPGEATPVVLPGQHVLPDSPRTGIVVNLPEMRLYYYPPVRPGEPPEVVTYPIGIGKEGWQMPEMQTRVSARLRNPAWQVPESIRQERAAEGISLPDTIPPGEDNPLGEFALRLGETGYLIHGSNRKYGIGMRVSHGCLRLEPDDIAALFAQVAVGTPVRVVDQPFKAGVRDGKLYLEAHPPLAEHVVGTGKTAMVAAIVRATWAADYEIDWDTALRMAESATGIAQEIGRRRADRRP